MILINSKYFPNNVNCLSGESLKYIISDEFDNLPIDEKLILAEIAIDFDIFNQLEDEAEDDVDLWHEIENNKYLLQKVQGWHRLDWLKL